jgi:hypothetical protein
VRRKGEAKRASQPGGEVSIAIGLVRDLGEHEMELRIGRVGVDQRIDQAAQQVGERGLGVVDQGALDGKY